MGARGVTSQVVDVQRSELGAAAGGVGLAYVQGLLRCARAVGGEAHAEGLEPGLAADEGGGGARAVVDVHLVDRDAVPRLCRSSRARRRARPGRRSWRRACRWTRSRGSRRARWPCPPGGSGRTAWMSPPGRRAWCSRCTPRLRPNPYRSRLSVSVSESASVSVSAPESSSTGDPSRLSSSQEVLEKPRSTAMKVVPKKDSGAASHVKLSILPSTFKVHHRGPGRNNELRRSVRRLENPASKGYGMVLLELGGSSSRRTAGEGFEAFFSAGGFRSDYNWGEP